MLTDRHFPYSSMQEINLDWILTKVKNILRFVPDDGAVGQILRRTAHGAEWSDEQGAGDSVTSVNGMQGAVVLDASDVGALPDTTVIPADTSDLTNTAGFVDAAGAAAAAPVQSVNSQTGAVVLGKSDVGLGSVDNVQQYSANNPPPYPVTSVNSQTGAVVLGKSDVGLGNVDNVQQYSASNPPPYPVTSVNGQTGAVVIASAPPTVFVDDTSYVNGSIYEVTKTYTVTGDGVVLVSAAAYSDTNNDFGMWQAEIYHNNTLIFGEGTRFSTHYDRRWGASASCPIQVSNGDTIKIYLYNSKIGTISVFRRFMCFGCTVS